MKKYCVKCGHEFNAAGREVICPSCKAQAAEDAKRAAVLKAKKASWSGESVPVRISGRASTIIRAYGAEKSLSFAAALDTLLKTSECFKGMRMSWEDITPYKSRRRDKHATEDAPQVKQDKPQDGAQTAQDVTSKPQEVKQAARVTRPATASKKASSKSSSKPSKSVKEG